MKSKPQRPESASQSGPGWRWLVLALFGGGTILVSSAWWQPHRRPSARYPSDEGGEWPSARERRSAAPAPPIAGYESVDFSTLGSFPFDPPPDILFAKSNTPATDARTLALVPDSIRTLDGHRITVRGFALPVRLVEGRAVEFLLMRDRSLCCFGITPQFNQWINVRVESPGVVVAQDVPTTVSGTVRVGAFREGGHLSGIYDLLADKISSTQRP